MNEAVREIIDREYAYGFHTDLETEVAPKGLNEDIVRFISARKGEPGWLLEWRLAAYRHFITLNEPTWPRLDIAAIDYQDMHYWAAPKERGPAPENLDEIDPEVRAMFDRLGISLREQERLSGVAVDAIIDSVLAAPLSAFQVGISSVSSAKTHEAIRNDS